MSGPGRMALLLAAGLVLSYIVAMAVAGLGLMLGTMAMVCC